MVNELGTAIREIINGRLDEINETTRAILLGVPEETVRKAHAKLIGLGVTPEKIASRAELLGLNPATIQKNADCLKALGLTPEKIASQAQLLGRDPETIQKNYEFMRRFFSKEKILSQLQLLGSTHATIESSVQFLNGIGVDHEKNANMCATTTSCKRKKVAVLLKERFGYSSALSLSEKQELLEKAGDFIRARPNILLMSEKKIRERFTAVR